MVNTIIATSDQPQTSSVERFFPLGFDNSKPIEARCIGIRIFVSESVKETPFKESRIVNIDNIIVPRDGEINSVRAKHRAVDFAGNQFNLAIWMCSLDNREIFKVDG